MSLGDQEVTRITQLPAIVRSGSVELINAELLKLDEKLLKEMATAMGGQLIYMKLRATYTELESSLCSYDNCYRHAHTLWCEDHPNGILAGKQSGRHLGIVNPNRRHDVS